MKQGIPADQPQEDVGARGESGGKRTAQGNPRGAGSHGRVGEGNLLPRSGYSQQVNGSTVEQTSELAEVGRLI